MKKLIIGTLLVLLPIICFSQSSQEVWNEIIKDSIKYPEIVFKQYIYETGWGKSNYCKIRHNLFGFQGSSGYMYFNTWQESILYYKKWQDRHYKGGNYEKFLVDVNYATGWNYVYELRKIKLPQYCYYGREENRISGCQ